MRQPRPPSGLTVRRTRWRALEEALEVAESDTRNTVVAAALEAAPGGQPLPEGAGDLEERRQELEEARRQLAELGRDAELVVVTGAPPT